MEKTNTKGLFALLTALLFIFYTLFNLCRVTVETAMSGSSYVACFEAYADTTASGVKLNEYAKLGTALGDYFSGRAETPQVTVTKTEGAAEAYSEKELAHLADVKALLSRLSAARYILLGVSAAMAGLLTWLYLKRSPKDEKERDRWVTAFVWPGVLIGVGAAVLLFLALGAWAYVNFDGLFVTLHRLLFDNDLWLLNPQTDLLIQLMPTRLFVNLSWAVIKDAAKNPAILAGLCVLAAIVLKRSEKKEKEKAK